MSTRRTHAAFLNDIKSALIQVKKETSTDQAKAYSLNAVRSNFTLPSVFAQALTESGFIELSRGVKGAAGRAHAVRWISDVDLNDVKVIDTFHRKLANLDSQRKAAYRTGVSKPQVKVEKEERVRRPYNKSGKHSNKIVQISKSLKSQQAKPVIKGAMFGLKQLQWMRMSIREKPTTVVLDEYVSIENVKAMTYHIEGTKLTIKFYGYGDHQGIDLTSKISEISVNNRVIALYEHGGDTQMEILKITTVPVNDPFNLNL